MKPYAHSSIRPSVPRVRRQRRQAQQQGFTLIEVLIAILILSIAALGMIALQLQSMRFAHDTSQRVAALQVLNNYTNMVLADPSQSMTYLDVDAGDAATTSCIGLTASCGPVEMAKFNMKMLRDQRKTDVSAGADPNNPLTQSMEIQAGSEGPIGVPSKTLVFTANWADKKTGRMPADPRMTVAVTNVGQIK